MAVHVLLHDEIIVEILLILPAKSLLRCQLVCKSWLNLINSTKFKLMHLHNFNQLNPRYFVCRFDYSSTKKWFRVHFDDEAFAFDTDVEFPFNKCFRIDGCCNGLVCLSDGDGYNSSSDRVVLWNPSIRRKLTLTLPTFHSEDLSVVLGLGYDKISDDYKLVRLVYVDDLFTRPRVEVYAVKTGIWREVVFPYDLGYFRVTYSNQRQVFYNGSVHWIASYPAPVDSLHNSIMTFDTSNDLFGEIQLPDDLLKVPKSTMMISVVGESFAVTYYNNVINGEEMDSSTYKIWVMKEYNNPTSWTLIHNMHYPDIDMGKPLKLQNKGNMMLESRDGNMIVYNYSGYACRICEGYESTMHYSTYVDKYQESLALLDVGYSASNEEIDEGSDDD